MAVVHHPAAAASRTRVAPGQRHEVLRSRVQHQAVVVQPHPQPVPHQPRGHRVEHPPQREAARPGHPHQGLLEVVGAPLRQRPQHYPLRIDALPAAHVAAARHLRHECPVGIQRLEVPRAPEQQCVLDRPLQMPVRTLDRPVLVRPAPVVAARLHPVVRQQPLAEAARLSQGGLGAGKAPTPRRKDLAAGHRQPPIPHPASDPRPQPRIPDPRPAQLGSRPPPAPRLDKLAGALSDRRAPED